MILSLGFNNSKWRPDRPGLLSVCGTLSSPWLLSSGHFVCVCTVLGSQDDLAYENCLTFRLGLVTLQSPFENGNLV